MGPPRNDGQVGRRYSSSDGLVARLPDDVFTCPYRHPQIGRLRRSPHEQVHEREPAHALGNGPVHHPLQRWPVPALPVTLPGFRSIQAIVGPCRPAMAGPMRLHAGSAGATVQ